MLVLKRHLRVLSSEVLEFIEYVGVLDSDEYGIVICEDQMKLDLDRFAKLNVIEPINYFKFLLLEEFHFCKSMYASYEEIISEIDGMENLSEIVHYTLYSSWEDICGRLKN